MKCSFYCFDDKFFISIDSSDFLCHFLEPPRRVSAPVARILENSKARVVDGVLIKPKYNARKFAMLRKRYISEGYYWPEKPMRDRTLDKAPTGTLREKRREER